MLVSGLGDIHLLELRITTVVVVEDFWFIVQGMVLISACLVVSQFTDMQRGCVF